MAAMRRTFLLPFLAAVYFYGSGAFMSPATWAPRIQAAQRGEASQRRHGQHRRLPLHDGKASNGRGDRTALKAGAETGFDLSGKVALVTGASRGIGAAIADTLAKAGATVVGTATSDAGAEAISARMGEQWGQGIKLDVTDSKNVEEVVKAVTEKYGAPDILVNNAGITKDTLMMRMKEDQWLDVINTNLNSVFRMTKAATKGMTKKRWGRVISISSVVGSMGNVGQSNYAAAKAGMDGWTRAMAREIGSRGITVNSVAPGFIDTMEIIVIDDGSDPPLQLKYEKLHMLRHDERRGLVKSKMEGGNAAKADMIMFLDAHVKPTSGWYKGLLRHLNINYKRVVVPLIPILNGDTWKINNMAVGVKMMFDWRLQFNWLDDGTDLVPCMSGGLFAISKRWWHESGEYDYGMNMWGAENIEQSIRIWLCGGEIFVARDSRIGHVFRSEFPYEINKTEVLLNKVRAVEAWFDEYKAYYYHAEPAASGFISSMGSIDDRLALKERLQCKPFSWFVHKFHKVFERKGMTPRESFQIRDSHTGHCLTTTESGDALKEATCEDEPKQRFAQHAMTIKSLASGLCLESESETTKARAGHPAKLAECSKRNSLQTWKFVRGHIRHNHDCIESKAEGPLAIHQCGQFLKGDGPFWFINHQVLPPE